MVKARHPDTGGTVWENIRLIMCLLFLLLKSIGCKGNKI